MNFAEFKKKRTIKQWLTWWGLPLVMIGGWFYPLLGYLLLGCMLGAIGIAFFKGRAWCDWNCPRGSFFDLFISKISPKRTIPALFYTTWFKIVIIGIMMTILGIQIYMAWGDWNGVGLAFVRLLTITTIAGIILGMVYHQRAWCHICPMGTVGGFIAKGKKPLFIDRSVACKCKSCAKVCPMQLNPFEAKETGIYDHPDCIKCSTCVAVCPNALTFKKAADSR